jgi:molybdopterin molybdotransferase
MLISPQNALDTVLRHVRPLKIAKLALGEALGGGFVLAQDIRCDRDQPPADRSAMDGYAVRLADLATVPARLELTGQIPAGSDAGLRLGRGTCQEIFTGANVPPGADAVVRLEDTRRQGDQVVVLAPARPGLNIRKRGEEARRGDLLLKSGQPITPAVLGVCATVGAARLRTRPMPKVAVLCSGAEVKDAAERVTSCQLRDSNGPALQGVLMQMGIKARRKIVPDDPKKIACCLRAAARSNDLVIITGGVSVGRYDFVPQAIEAIGGRVRFHGVRMKPGKPQLFATLGLNRYIFALPGNPVSVLTGFWTLVAPALRRLTGVAPGKCSPVLKLPASQAVPGQSKGQRVVFRLARMVQTSAGLAVAPIDSAGSADIIAACRADGVMIIPAGGRKISAGAMVQFLPWKWAI